ncbi:MAG: efflux RND transporter periplasmic adaptor subunit [Deltaproteobacteria bacterium]|nr:efflux RND transporter periplasmic adaptor subunit [Deltaproteobacteria bacterium]
MLNQIKNIMDEKNPDKAVIMPSSATMAGSGAAMDQKIVNSGRKWKYMIVSTITVIIAGVAIWSVMSLNGDRSFRVEADTLTIAKVTTGIFEDYIPIRGSIVPRTTVFLDAIEGGRVDTVYAEDGDILNKGDLIVSLTNSSLQLQVTNSEAQVAEQLNNMRTIELSLEQNRLNNARTIVDIEHQVRTLERDLKADRELSELGFISKKELVDKENELLYQQNLLELSKESQKTDERLQKQQLEAQKTATERLEKNLVTARKNLDDLNIKAPIAGKLSGFDAEVGQNIMPGVRIGQIDIPDKFKLQADIDEFYINRVDIGQSVAYQHNGKDYKAEIKKIYPQVKDGKFQVDIEFSDKEPPALRRGQTLQAKLTLGDESEAVLIPNGSFYQDTGGNWIFVVTKDGVEAVKRSIRLGRRNSSYIEVVEGLQSGEQVVTSSYSGFPEIDKLKIKGGE